MSRWQSYCETGKVFRASSPLELIHSDICGPMRHGANHFLTFIDDYSRYEYMCLLSHRYEAIDVFKRFVAKVNTTLEQRVKTL